MESQPFSLDLFPTLDFGWTNLHDVQLLTCIQALVGGAELGLWGDGDLAVLLHGLVVRCC